MANSTVQAYESNKCTHLEPLGEEDLEYHDRFVCINPPLTDDQRNAIEALKEKLADVREEKDDDVLLRRFLVAREWNPAGAEEMFRGEKVWRKANLPKVCLAESVLRMLRFKCAEILPFTRDRYDRPLVIITGRNFNPGMNGRDNEQMADMFVWGMEVLIASVRPPQPQFVTIVDLEGWGLKNFDTKLAHALAMIAKPYYPDYMGSTFIINYPWVMWGVWKLANVLIEERTKKKIQFLSKEEYMRLLPLMFGKKDLPQRFGGDLVEPDLKGSRSESDAGVCEEWGKVKALPKEEQQEKFLAMLEEFLNETGQSEWLPMVDTANLKAGITDKLPSSGLQKTKGRKKKKSKESDSGDKASSSGTPKKKRSKSKTGKSSSANTIDAVDSKNPTSKKKSASISGVGVENGDVKQ